MNKHHIRLVYTMALLLIMVSVTGIPDAVAKPKLVKAGAADAGFDARLSNYQYPYPTKTFKFEAQHQKLEMIYMDISPAKSKQNGETVLLLHGKNFSGAYWANTIAPLLEKGYRVIAPDQIGFGKSSKPENFQYSFHALAGYTFNLLKSLKVDKVHVVGHSMGGMLATRFILMFPDNTNSLTLVNPIGLEDWKLKVPYRPIEWWYQREIGKTAKKVRAYMTKSYFDGIWKTEYEPLIKLQAGWIKGPDYKIIAKNSALAYDMIFTQPVLYEFGTIKVPVLLIIGTRDRTALGKPLVSPKVRATLGDYPKIAKEAARAIPNARLELIEGIGHLPQYESYKKYIQLLTGFLAEQSK